MDALTHQNNQHLGSVPRGYVGTIVAIEKDMSNSVLSAGKLERNGRKRFRVAFMSNSRTKIIIALAICLSWTTSYAAERELRLSPSDMTGLKAEGAGAGSSGVLGIQTVVLSGDPKAKGLYSIKLSVPPNTRIQAHTHQDERSASVVSGMWKIGYGKHFEESSLKAMPPGSFYTEPAGVAHFAETGPEPVIVFITGYGPTDTVYVDKADNPRR